MYNAMYNSQQYAAASAAAAALHQHAQQQQQNAQSPASSAAGSPTTSAIPGYPGFPPMPMGFPGIPGLPMPNTLFPGAPGMNPALFSPRPAEQRVADKPSKPRPSQPKPAPKKVATATPAGSPGAASGAGASGMRQSDGGREPALASNAHAAALQALASARQPAAGNKAEPAKGGNDSSAANGNGASSAPGAEVHVDATNALDVMTGAGIDLRAEQEAIGGTATSAAGVPGQFRRAGADETQGGLYLHALDLSVKVHQIATQQGLQVDPMVLNYLSLATRQRFRNLLESMVRTARHRKWSAQDASPGFWPSKKKRSADDANLDEDMRNAEGDPERIPLFHQEVVQNPELLLSALEKVERRTEMRAKQKRAEREARYRAAMEAQAAAGEAAGAARSGQPADAAAGAITVEEGGKKKHVSLKHATPDIQKKLADSVAQSALGGGSSRYSWMSSGVHGFGGVGAGSQGAGGKDADAEAGEKDSPAGAGNGPGAAGAPAAPGAWGDLASRQAAKAAEEAAAVTRVTMSDALAALEREKAGGAGLGSGIATLRTTRALGRPAFRVPPPQPKTFSAPPAS